MLDSNAATYPRPHAILEAGDEGSQILTAAMTRRIETMAPGQILHVISQASNAQTDAIAWCHVTGHELLALVVEDGSVQFWIRKKDVR
jgi:TusA-related sulfurtransferase